LVKPNGSQAFPGQQSASVQLLIKHSKAVAMPGQGCQLA